MQPNKHDAIQTLRSLKISNTKGNYHQDQSYQQNKTKEEIPAFYRTIKLRIHNKRIHK